MSGLLDDGLAMIRRVTARIIADARVARARGLTIGRLYGSGSVAAVYGVTDRPLERTVACARTKLNGSDTNQPVTNKHGRRLVVRVEKINATEGWFAEKRMWSHLYATLSGDAMSLFMKPMTDTWTTVGGVPYSVSLMRGARYTLESWIADFVRRLRYGGASVANENATLHALMQSTLLAVLALNGACVVHGDVYSRNILMCDTEYTSIRARTDIGTHRIQIVGGVRQLLCDWGLFSGKPVGFSLKQRQDYIGIVNARGVKRFAPNRPYGTHTMITNLRPQWHDVLGAVQCFGVVAEAARKYRVRDSMGCDAPSDAFELWHDRAHASIIFAIQCGGSWEDARTVTLRLLEQSLVTDEVSEGSVGDSQTIEVCLQSFNKISV